ncbi:MAG: hypothetical protein J6W96_02360 [Alphaproteobacteria bacterium]|nr:hypothetical protein [Alphaproteobacteria bacterium]
MKKVFFALILSLFLAIEAQATENTQKYLNECLDFIQPPEVNLYSSYGKLRYKFDKDINFLRQKTAQKFANQNKTLSDAFLPIGLTDVRDVVDFDFNVETMGLSHGYVCVYPKSLNVRLEYSLPTIYILNTLKEGSCLYDVALRHEKTHMQIYIEALDYFLPILKSYIEEQFSQIGVMVVARGDFVEDAATQLNQAYFSSIQKRIDVWRREVEAEQLKLDTPENYILENRLCQEIEAQKLL